MTHPHDKQKEADIAARQATVAGLMLSGVRNQKQLAALVNVNQSTISRDIKAIKAEWKRQAIVAIDEAKTIDLMRIDEALRAVMPLVRKGDMAAVDRMTGLLKRRADIFGYDAPKRVEGKFDIETRRAAEQVAAELGLSVDEVLEEAERILKKVTA